MKFSYSAVWNDTVHLMRANMGLLLAVAGVFLFLPALIGGYLIPQPGTGGGEQATVAMLLAHVEEHWLALLIINLIGFVGNLTLLILVLDHSRPTVGRAIGIGLAILPFYFLASVVSGLILFLAMLAFIIPGLYAIGRLAVLGPVIVAEHRRSPIEAIGRTFAVSKGNGWAVFGLLCIVVVTFWIVSIAATTVLGSVFLLIDRASGGPGVGAVLVLILESGIGAVFNTVLVVLLAAIYLRLTAAEPSTNGI